MTKTPLPKIGAPATRALNGVGIFTLEQLMKKTEKEISELHGMGPKAIKILKAELERLGRALKDKKA